LVNIAIIGSGSWSRIIAEIYNKIIGKIKANNKISLDIELSGFWSKDKTNQGEFTKKYCIKKIYDTKEDILNDDNIDLVEICGLIKERPEIVINAIKKGKHVSVEPPLSLNLQEINEIINTLKKSSHNKSFRINNLLINSYQFQKTLQYVRKKKLGKIFTVNIASFSNGNPELELFNDAYSVAEYIYELLGKIELVFGWAPNGLDGKFTNRIDLNCNFVPKNKSKHGTWTHRFLPNLKINNSYSNNEYTLDTVSSHSISFSYGATGELFNNSPISSGPGIYWCHQNDHKWKSDFQENINCKEYLISHTLEFIKSIANGKRFKIDHKKIINSQEIVNCIIKSTINNGDPIKIKDAPIDASKILKKGNA